MGVKRRKLAMAALMLKGYVLTDQSCPTPGCAVPMLRTPKGKSPVLTFCVQCDKESHASNLTPSEMPAPPSNSSSSHHSHPSTPLTEFSEATNSSAFELPPETYEARRRREQSDQASSEIGKKLLKGWAMLGDECPSDSCYGVPLVRPPNVGGVLDSRKECVICGKAYTTEIDWAGNGTLVPYMIKTDNATLMSGPKTPDILRGPPQKKPRLLSPLDAHPRQDAVTVPDEVVLIDSTRAGFPDTTVKPFRSGAEAALYETSSALQASLEALSSRLQSLTSETILDMESISMTADAINKVTRALRQVRQLQLKY